MLTKSILLKHYKRPEIQEALVVHAEDKEIGFRYGEDTFGKRPDVLSYPRDVLELALQNVTSFHASEELWENPLALNSNLSKQELHKLRKGWDLVLDIDCKFLDYSKICAILIIQFLKHCGVQDVSCKFSGNKGFHIGVPFEAFPRQVGSQQTKNLFPEAPRKIAFYVKENIKEELGRRILQFENNDFSKVLEKTGAKKEEIVAYQKDSFGTAIPYLNVEPFLEIDTILLASRHLYRMPYSLHEKSGLVSLPLDSGKVMEFRKEMAKPETIGAPLLPFLDRHVQGESARRLLVQALDFKVKMDEPTVTAAPKYEELTIESPIKEEFFPPCMRLALEGLEDGKKRAVFLLGNFLGKLGWNEEQIKAYILQWNKEKNKQPLREQYILGQLRAGKPGERLPPNCANEAYYKGIGICRPDNFCSRIKNPVNYSILKWKRQLRDKEESESEKKIK